MLICAKSYFGVMPKDLTAPKIYCSLSGCYCNYTAWVRGAHDQTNKAIECPRYEGTDELTEKEREVQDSINDFMREASRKIEELKSYEKSTGGRSILRGKG